MSILIEIVTNGAVSRIAFGADKELAQQQLDLLRPKLRGRLSMRMNGIEEDTHTIKSPAGDVVIVLEHVHNARVVDMAMHTALTADDEDRYIQHQVKLAAAQAAAVIPADRRDERIAELKRERDDYKQAAEVEAQLKREFRDQHRSSANPPSPDAP